MHEKHSCSSSSLSLHIYLCIYIYVFIILNFILCLICFTIYKYLYNLLKTQVSKEKEPCVALMLLLHIAPGDDHVPCLYNVPLGPIRAVACIQLVSDFESSCKMERESQ